MSGGMDNLYNEFQNVPNTGQKEIDIEKIYNKTLTPNNDMTTDIPNAYNLVVMSGISKYITTKYNDEAYKKYVAIMVAPINFFVKGYKNLNPSTNGKRTSDVLSSLSRFVEYVKNRNTIQRLTGASDKGNE
jgi:hypothetical protein